MKSTLFHNLAPFTHTQRQSQREKKQPKNKQKTKTNKQIKKERKAKKQLTSTVIRVGSVVAASKVKNVFSEFPPSSPKNPHFQRKIAPIIVFTSSQSPPGPSAIATISSSCSLSFILLPATKVVNNSSSISSSIMLISDQI
jgi:hypothetical protein